MWKCILFLIIRVMAIQSVFGRLFSMGLITAVSAIPDMDSNYFLEITFPNGLHTNYGKTLPPLKQMVGSAEIIVKDKRLIENLLEPIEKVLRD